jgi:hypothetical protein
MLAITGTSLRLIDDVPVYSVPFAKTAAYPPELGMIIASDPTAAPLPVAGNPRVSPGVSPRLARVELTGRSHRDVQPVVDHVADAPVK